MSGPANQAYHISSQLEQNHIKSPIFTTNFNSESEPFHEIIDNVEVYRFPIKAKFMKYFYTPDLKTYLEKSKFDIYHAHSYRSYQTEIAFKIAKKKDKPFIINNHGSLYAYKFLTHGLKKLPYILYDFLNKKIMHKANFVIVNTSHELEMVYEQGISYKKIKLIPVPIDASKYKPLDKKWDELRLLFVGRICRDRNLENILKALSYLKEEKIKLRIVGNIVKRTDTEKGGYLKEIKKLVDKLEIHPYIEFLGPKYGRDLLNIYKTSDIFLYTSIWENFGQTILEAAAAGLPLICTPVGVSLDLIDNGETGFFVDPNNPKEIVSSILKIKNMDISKIKKRLRQQVKNHYSIEKVYKKYFKLYQKAIE